MRLLRLASYVISTYICKPVIQSFFWMKREFKINTTEDSYRYVHAPLPYEELMTDKLLTYFRKAQLHSGLWKFKSSLNYINSKQEPSNLDVCPHWYLSGSQRGKSPIFPEFLINGILRIWTSWKFIRVINYTLFHNIWGAFCRKRDT